MKVVDSHCHLDSYADPAAIARAARDADVLIVGVTNLPSHFFLGLPHARSLPGVRLAVGMHPLAAEPGSRELADFRRALSLTSFVGEVGLDLSEEGRRTQSCQFENFEAILQLLSDRPRFVTLHSRKAEAEVLKLLRTFGISGAVLHWYSGPVRLIDEFLADGHYFSVNPAMVERPSGRRVIEAIPPERTLTESDGPHVKHRGRPSRPDDMRFVAERLARTWQVSPSEAVGITAANFMNIVTRGQPAPIAEASRPISRDR